MTVASLADFSHLLRASCEMRLDVAAFGPEKGLLSEAVLALSISGMSDQPIYDLMPFIVSLYVCSSEGIWSGSKAVTSGSSDSSPSSAYRSTSGRSENSLSVPELSTVLPVSMK